MPYITESTMQSQAGRGGHGGHGGRGRGGRVVFFGGNDWGYGYPYYYAPPCVPGDPRPQCYYPYGPLPSAVQGAVEQAQAGQAELPVIAPVPAWTTAYYPVARVSRTVDSMSDAYARDPRLAPFRPVIPHRSLTGQGSTQCPTHIPYGTLCDMASFEALNPLAFPPGGALSPYYDMPCLVMPPSAPPTTPIFQPPVPGPGTVIPPSYTLAPPPAPPMPPAPPPIVMPPPAPPVPPAFTFTRPSDTGVPGTVVMPPQPVPPPQGSTDGTTLPPAVSVTAPLPKITFVHPPPPPLPKITFVHPPKTAIQGRGLPMGQRPLVLSYGYANPLYARGLPGTVRQFALGPAERVTRDGRIQRQDPRTGVWL